MPKKKVIIFYLSMGTGHKMAAIAIEERLKKYPQLEVILKDWLDFLGERFRKSLQVYHGTINTTAGRIYDYFWRSEKFIPAERKLKEISLRVSKEFTDYIFDERPSVIVCAHAFPSIVLSSLKEKGIVSDIPHIGVGTDFIEHKWWPIFGIDFYTVAVEEAKKEMLNAGFDGKKIIVTGIPVREQFVDGAAIKRNNKTPQFLFLCGSIERGIYRKNERFLKKFLQGFKDAAGCQLYIITGRNEVFKSELEKQIKERKLKNIKVFGFVEDMGKMMKKVDLLITKPGGLICSEAVSIGLPLVLIGPSFGQEKGNAQYLEKKGAAVNIRKAEELHQILGILAKDRRKLYQMAECSKEVSKPRAAEDIANLILQIAG